MKIAIIGAGISGLGAAWLLDSHHEITLYEANDYWGGHSRTIEIEEQSQTIPVDTGFIVFNDWNYHHLTGLLRALDVPYEKSDMSFGISIRDGWLEYTSHNILGRPANWVRPGYWLMIRDTLRFFKKAPEYLDMDPSVTLGRCLDELNMGSWFKNYFILPMGASIWSCSAQQMLQFPAHTFIRFFQNHGLLNLLERPQWYTVSGGSREYVRRIVGGLKGRTLKNCSVKNVERKESGVYVTDRRGQVETYDHVIFSCHGNQILRLLANSTPEERRILSAFTFQNNEIVVHKDESFMPHDKKCWSSWVYLSQQSQDLKDTVSLSYWMNSLQNINRDTPIFITLNPERQPPEELVYDRHSFSHPVFDHNAIAAQKALPQIQGKDRLWFCGAYTRYGFHEDGLLSAVNVAKNFGVEIPWT